MKATTTAVANLLAAAQSAPDATLAFAECYTFTLATGAVYRWTNFDLPIAYGGYVFSASGPLVQGLKSKASVGLEVDRQQITIAARPTDLIGGAPALIAIRDGAFDGAQVQRDRVFLVWSTSGPTPDFSSDFSSDFVPPAGPLTPVVVGGVTMFKGFVSTVDSVGRTQATITVASALVILDQDMPRNLYSATCVHTLYDSGCGIPRGAFAASGTAGAGSTSNTILSGVATAQHRGGSLVWTSGANANLRTTVKAVSPGAAFALMVPLPFAPAPGDAFTVYAGCDHTQATCRGTFGNLSRFRGFPYVPPPEMAY